MNNPETTNVSASMTSAGRTPMKATANPPPTAPTVWPARNVVENAKALAETLRGHGLDIVSGGTDNHLMLVDLSPKGLTGKAAEAALSRAHITCNKNGIPFDTQKPMVTSGIRLGSPAATSRGFGRAEFAKVGELIVETLDGLAANGESGNVAVEAKVRAEVAALTRRFPIY